MPNLKLLDEGLQIYIPSSQGLRKTEHLDTTIKKPEIPLLTPPSDLPPRNASLHQRHKTKALYHIKNTRVSYM